MSVAKEGYEDWKRYKADKEVNESVTLVWRGSSFESCRWQELAVGEIVKVRSHLYLIRCALLKNAKPGERSWWAHTGVGKAPAFKQPHAARWRHEYQTVLENNSDFLNKCHNHSIMSLLAAGEARRVFPRGHRVSDVGAGGGHVLRGDHEPGR